VTLREAAQGAFDAFDQAQMNYGHLDPPVPYLLEAMQNLRAALARSESPSPEGLTEAALLSEAFVNVTRRRLPMVPAWDALDDETRRKSTNDSAEVLAEVARLRSLPADSETT
jgi:hypothetical protein